MKYVPGIGYCCILTGGPTHTITVDGKVMTFEMHHYFGPGVLKKDGDPYARQPGPRHPFWDAVTAWCKQGKRLTDDGECIWEPEKEPELEHLGGKHYRVVQWKDTRPWTSIRGFDSSPGRHPRRE